MSAHWDDISPASRFGLVLSLVALFHVTGAFVADRFPAMATALHGVGTMALDCWHLSRRPSSTWMNTGRRRC